MEGSVIDNCHFVWKVYRLISRVIFSERVVKLGKEAIRDDDL